MRAEAARLEAEIYGGSLSARCRVKSAAISKYLKLQSDDFHHRRAEYEAAISASDSDTARLEAALVTNRDLPARLEGAHR